MVLRNVTGSPILLILLVKLFHFRVPPYKSEKHEREEMPLGTLKSTLPFVSCEGTKDLTQNKSQKQRG